MYVYQSLYRTSMMNKVSYYDGLTMDYIKKTYIFLYITSVKTQFLFKLKGTQSMKEWICIASQVSIYKNAYGLHTI